ncbi:endonuclease V isoform X3 [Rousettus aegyptiacus]|uniref:Endonuclease V n=1 Tax=Rousettus aegyptiacus TaxID=9407 RepID=A0A7J8G886_ROUAE|nr:endonuclease V isoform X3 [Rousettus aegyptiacus]KAF6455859.1 endonuclease V [Rousettus aegyptiacus]
MAREAVRRLPEGTLSLWKREQAVLKARVVDRDTEAWQRDPAFSGLLRVGGLDVSFVKGDSVSACASLVVLSYPKLEVLYEDCRMVSLTAPYVPGFLAFREGPFLVDAVQRLQEKEPHLSPQVLLVDGNGVLHPRDTPAAGWRRHVPSDGRLRGRPGHGPEEPRPQHQASLRLSGPQDEPGGRRASRPQLLQISDPGARAPGAGKHRDQRHASREAQKSPPTVKALGPIQKPQTQAPRSSRTRGRAGAGHPEDWPPATCSSLRHKPQGLLCRYRGSRP